MNYRARKRYTSAHSYQITPQAAHNLSRVMVVLSESVCADCCAERSSPQFPSARALWMSGREVPIGLAPPVVQHGERGRMNGAKVWWFFLVCDL
jgi:hypothetical protein